MKLTANIATYPPRKDNLIKMLESIEGQFDEVRIYYNQVSSKPKYLPDWVQVETGANLTDNGKFYFIQPDEIYCTLDDDLIYPETYAQDMKAAVIKHKCIVTHHGRTLRPNRTYYRGHQVYHCLLNVRANKRIDVAGTGVMAFDTNYFAPKIWHSEYLRMSDIIFSLEAAIAGKKIMILPHSKGYIKHLDSAETIHNTLSRGDTPIHDEFCNEIIKLRR